MVVLNSLKLLLLVKADDKNVESSRLHSQYDMFYKFYAAISQAMGLSYEVIVVKEDGIPMPNGSWTGAIGMLQRGEVDVAFPLIVSEERVKVVKFTFPSYIEIMTFAGRKFEINNEFSSVFRPCHRDVWIAILASTIIMFLVLYMFQHRSTNIVDVIFKVLKPILGQSTRLKVKKTKIYIFFFFIWILATFFIVNCYKSVLLSFLTLPSYKEIKSISQLATEVQEGRIQCLIRPISNAFTKVFIDSSRPEVRIIGNHLKQNPGLRGSIRSIVESTNSKKVFIGARSNLEFLKEFNFLVSEDTFFLAFATYAVRKNFCCKEQLDMIIHRLTAAGIFSQFLKEENFRTTYHASASYNDKATGVSPLTVRNLYGSFIFLFSGYLLSFLALCFELVHRSCISSFPKP